MTDTIRDWYYADAPSPAHDAIKELTKSHHATKRRTRALCKEIGAETAAYRGSHLCGFIFSGDVPPTNWRKLAVSASRPVFTPKRAGAANRKLLATMNTLSLPDYLDLPAMLGISRWVIYGNHLYKTAVHSRGGRVFFGIPKSKPGARGDKPVQVPAWLTPCPAWAKDKFLDTGTD